MTQHHKHATVANPGPSKATSTAKAAVASGDNNVPSVSTEAIRLCAYRKWESAGKPTGDGIRFWLEAELEMVPKKHGQSQDADRHSNIRHPDSQK
jgi:hypothetical protein